MSLASDSVENKWRETTVETNIVSACVRFRTKLLDQGLLWGLSAESRRCQRGSFRHSQLSRSKGRVGGLGGPRRL